MQIFTAIKLRKQMIGMEQRIDLFSFFKPLKTFLKLLIFSKLKSHQIFLKKMRSIQPWMYQVQNF